MEKVALEYHSASFLERFLSLSFLDSLLMAVQDLFQSIVFGENGFGVPLGFLAELAGCWKPGQIFVPHLGGLVDFVGMYIVQVFTCGSGTIFDIPSSLSLSVLSRRVRLARPSHNLPVLAVISATEAKKKVIWLTRTLGVRE